MENDKFTDDKQVVINCPYTHHDICPINNIIVTMAPRDLYVRLTISLLYNPVYDNIVIMAPRDLYVRLIMKRETATPTKTLASTQVLAATPTSTHSPASLIGRSGGGKSSKQKVQITTGNEVF